jgi:hypothetical protein
MDSLLSELDIQASAYADDLKLTPNLARHRPASIQTNINCVFSWSEARGMPLSMDKSLVVHCGVANPRHRYHCSSCLLPEADSIRDLGVTRSSDCTFREHVSLLAQRGRQLVGRCFRAIQSRNPIFMLRVYRTYILPVLNYASPIWSPHLRQEINELESVQRRFTKRLAGQAQHSYRERLRNLSLLSLESQRRLTDHVITYKLCRGMMGISLEDGGRRSLSVNQKH